MTLIHAILIFTAICCFSGYVWSIKKFFTRPQGVPSGMRAISTLGGIFSLLHVLMLGFRVSATGFRIAGIILYLCAMVVFWLAISANSQKPLSLAYSGDKPGHLVQHGIYHYVRHPFYTSYSLAWLAGVVGSKTLWLLPTLLIMVYLYFCSARQEEQKFLMSDFAQDYKSYQQQTGMFFPRVSKKYVRTLE